MNKTKLLLKLINEKRGTVEWEHICYVPSDMFSLFMSKKGYETTGLNECFSRWVKEDFNLNINFSKSSDVDVLRAIVKDFYKTTYPLFFLDSKTDRQGWMRIWVVKKMKEELGQYREERI